MRKIRVYELAKEAGMDSKDLTAKLIEMGYSVKAYNSTLDDDTADDIRRKLGFVKVDVEETRIQSKGHTTIIRRRSKVVPEAPVAKELPEEEGLAAAAEIPAAEGEALEPISPEPTEVVEPAITETPETLDEKTEAAEAAQAPEEAEEKAPEAATPALPPETEAEGVQVTPAEDAKDAEVKKEVARPQNNGYAKIVGQA
ncbi:MAG: translation initiation factor IF-2 N-terminal domain-containing protein, partial [Deltaproteobacteria bacterium]|nr:translation initiation factor IF-2 N-terminal domain-containing protein [Deltaproteobacteria bacterium]